MRITSLRPHKTIFPTYALTLKAEMAEITVMTHLTILMIHGWNEKREKKRRIFEWKSSHEMNEKDF